MGGRNGNGKEDGLDPEAKNPLEEYIDKLSRYVSEIRECLGSWPRRDDGPLINISKLSQEEADHVASQLRAFIGYRQASRRFWQQARGWTERIDQGLDAAIADPAMLDDRMAYAQILQDEITRQFDQVATLWDVGYSTRQAADLDVNPDTAALN